ncbi:hypothetical protein BDB01DRAFT_853710 [Pilobolus umbonatus]|nr:hypothetical protein BDB01DRAFT_853710 [Pilobolus umbonatus]
MSLKEQLQKIGTVDLRNVSETSRRFKPSFLFTAREAADHDLETIYSIAYNGIMELSMIDDKFTAFEHTLFSESMKSVDRVLKTAEENKQLDTSIDAFLCQLSPYFLLKPAGKVLEYLIRRFNIQEFNIESILKCVLPYHETKSFVKMVVLLNIKPNTPWEFLLPVKKSATPLERSLLVKRMHKDRYVFDFMCKMVVEAQVPFKGLYSFYAALMTDFIKFNTKVTAEMTTAITPPLIDGIKAKKLPELQMASYMILSQLSSKTLFNKDAAEIIVDEILKNSNKRIYGFSLLTVVHICQTQPNFEKCSRHAAKRLFKNEHFQENIFEIADKYATDNFFKAFMSYLCQPQYKLVEFLEALVLKDYLSSANISLLCDTVISGYIDLVKEQKEEETKKEYITYFQSLLAMISQRYIEELDRVLESKLEDKKNESISKDLYEFTSTAFKGTRHELIAEANTTLYLCLNSASISNRLLAIKKLVSIVNDQSNILNQSPDIIESSLLSCLEDFNALLSYVIEEASEQLLAYVPPSKILDALVTLIKGRGALHQASIVSVMKFLLKEFITKHPEMDEEVSRILAVFIFGSSSGKIKAVVTKGNTKFGKTSVLKSMMTNIKSSINANKKGEDIEIPISFLKLQADQVKQGNPANLFKFWVNRMKSDWDAEKVVASLVLSNVIVTLKGESQYAMALEVVDAILRSLNTPSALFSASFSDNLMKDAQNGLPSIETIRSLRRVDKLPEEALIQLAQFTLLSLVNSMERPEGYINWYKLAESPSSGDVYAQLVIKLFNVFTDNSTLGSFETAISQLIQSQTKEDTIRFLISIWSNESNHYIVRARALQITCLYLKKYADEHANIDFQHMIPAIFPTLADTHISIRTQSVRCLEVIRTIYNQSGYPHGKKIYETATDAVTEKTKPNPLDILPISDFYNKDISAESLRSNEAAHLVDFFFYRNAEITKDYNYAKQLFADYLLMCEQSKEKQYRVRKDRTLEFLLSHILTSPTVHMKIYLLKMLDPIKSPMKLRILLPLFDVVLNQPHNKDNTVLVEYLIRTFTSTAPLTDKPSVSLFLRLLKNQDSLEGSDEEGWQLSTRRFALRQITPEFYKIALDDKVKQSVFNTLIDIATHGIQNDVRTAKQVLSEIDIPAKLFDITLSGAARSLMGIEAIEPMVVKRRRSNAGLPKTKKTTVDLYELVTLLELIETNKQIQGEESLVKPLFEVLSAMVNADLRDTPVSLEYINQLIMSSLTRILQSAEDRKVVIEESTLRVDIVVQCIRITGNPQTHNQALLLMATIASMYPECVLHNIMPVFTFMGANVLRQDDNYSFQVIQQTLEKILPPLVVSSRKTTQEDTVALVLEVKPIIKVFVDALFHIPKHRRLRLFTVLIHTLGEDEFLSAIVSLLIEKFTDKLNKGVRSDADTLTEFSLLICHSFSSETQLKAVMDLLQGLLLLPNEKPEDVTMSEVHLFNIQEHSDKQLRQYKLATLNFANELLSSKGFLSKVLAQSNASDDYLDSLQPLCLQTIETILKIVTYFSNFRDTYTVSENANPSISKFWRGIIKVVYDVLDKVNTLLPIDAFANVISKLIYHGDSAIRRKALTIFHEKIVSFEGHAPEGSEEVLVKMIPLFTDLIEKESKSVASEENQAANKQAALLCITSLAKALGHLYPGQFSDSIPVIIGTESLQQFKHSQLQISSLVALAVITQEIGPRAVPHLPKFMPLLTDILTTTVTAENPNPLLQVGLLTCLETIIRVLPHFISPYLNQLLSGLFHPSIYNYDSALTQRQTIETKATTVLTEIAHHVPPRVLLNPVFSFYETAVKNGKKSLLSYMNVVSQAIRSISRETMVSHYKPLFKFFLQSFDISRTLPDEDIEDAVISAFLDLVMKLNETLFKPLYLKIVDWATVENQENDRVLFLYKLTDRLLEKLKSIFSPYYGYLIDDVITRLNTYKDHEVDGLWKYLMSSLHKSFLYDTDNLWTATKFEKIIDPVVDQLMIHGTDYLDLMVTYVVPCVGQMAVTISNDTLWKPLNHKVLLKTREDDPEIRLAALRCIQEFYQRLGEEWLLFLAESISFLAELMEDDDVRVEKLVQQVNAEIESHLGESLDKFFN